MTEATATNPLAPHHIPFFITAPGDTDFLSIVVWIIVVVIILLIGSFYFRLHALPEHMAHRADKVQFEIVSVLALLALFTHNHLFWIAALLLALVQIPDFMTPLQGIAASLARIASSTRPPRVGSAMPSQDAVAALTGQVSGPVDGSPVEAKSEGRGHA